jgi:hypothetical protein
MVQELLSILPAELTTPQAVVCLAIVIAGVFLWLMGVAWGRAILTLLAVGLGATIGLLVPRWQMWPINSMSTAVLGAVALGVSAFLAEKAWAGIVLAVVLVSWTSLAVWMQFGAHEQLEQQPVWETQVATPPEQARALWEAQSPTVRRVLPFASATAIVSALALTLLWPRVAKLLAFSSLGVTMLFVAGLALVTARHPEWLDMIPIEASAQAGVLAGMVLLGAVVQWQLLSTTGHRNRPTEPIQQEQAPEEVSTVAISRGKFV